MALLPIDSNFMVQVVLRLDDDCPAWWESRVVNVKVVSLESEASEYR